MKTYTSHEGIQIKVGENAKENDEMTLSSHHKEWWLHVEGVPGSHVIICHDGDTIPKETKRDAATLAVHHSKHANIRMARVNLVRVEQVRQNKCHGQVHIDGDVTQLTIFPNKEKPRLDRLKAFMIF